ncbi:MAG: ArsR/SmtB family transcription factor [Solirubrobacteraceae bacterium]
MAQRLDAISHEARVMLVDTLDRRGELSVSELAETVGIRVYDASPHLSVLRGAGVVSRHRHGQHVGYRLDDPTVLAIYEQVAGPHPQPNRARSQRVQARRVSHRLKDPTVLAVYRRRVMLRLRAISVGGVGAFLTPGRVLQGSVDRLTRTRLGAWRCCLLYRGRMAATHWMVCTWSRRACGHS